VLDRISVRNASKTVPGEVFANDSQLKTHRRGETANENLIWICFRSQASKQDARHNHPCAVRSA
jgi:hypothetical protein